MKHYKFLSLVALSLIFTFFSSCNKDDSGDEPFKMPSKIINQIKIDSEGVKWFATEKGVVSFDGVKWTSYSDDQNLSTGPISDLALEAQTGIRKLWLAGTAGLSAFEFTTSAISFLNYDSSNSEILSDEVTALGVDKNNVKYVGTSKGLSILKGDKWDEFYGRKTEEILSEYRISSVATASNGSVYAATEGGGVSKFKYTDAVSGATTLSVPWANGLPSDTVYTVYVDGITQWYGTFRGAAYHSTESTKNDWTTYTRAEGLICDSVYAITKDTSGSIWFGTHLGVNKLANDSIWTSFTTKDGLIANKVNAVAADIDGSVWFGTDAGISHFSNNKWTNY